MYPRPTSFIWTTNGWIDAPHALDDDDEVSNLLHYNLYDHLYLLHFYAHHS